MPDLYVDQDALPDEAPEIKLPVQTPEESEKKEETDAIKSPQTSSKEELISELHLEEHKKKHLHAFSSYSEDSPDVKFLNELDNEIILLFLRRHIATNFPWVIKALALALIPVLFEILGSLGFFSITFMGVEGKFIIYTFYYFFIFSGYMFVNYLSWFYNISIVTNIRIVDIDFSQLVYENVDATKLNQIEDVSYSQIGILRSIFDYGDVFLQTAGAKNNFEFLMVPHPEKVIRVIGDLIGKKPK